MRPLIGVPGRFASRADGLRKEAIVNAERLLRSIYRAGGEPLTLFPEGATTDRFEMLDGVLLPGGGDVDPALYGEAIANDSVYGVNRAQDEFDMALLKWALDNGVPTFAICRGVQVVNVALGGSLEQDMNEPHRDHIHEVTVTGAIAEITGSTVQASCFHHQRVKTLAPGLRVLATDHDGTIEAVDLPDSKAWFLGTQWHPEDTAADDKAQQGLIDAFVAEARQFKAARGR